MQIDYTLEEKMQLIQKFKSLKTLKQKFKFWEEKFELNYISFLFWSNRYNYYKRSFKESEDVFWLKDFVIKPDQNEIKKYNLFVAEQSKANRKLSNIKFHIYDYDHLIATFEDQIKNIANKEFYIEKEIKNIDQLVFEQETQRKNNNTDSRPRYFLDGYREQYYNDKEPDLGEKVLDYLHLYSLKNGNELAKYQKYLVRELRKVKSKINKIESGKKFTIKQQLIALHYLGALSKIRANKDENASKQAAFLHLLTGSSFQNFRDALSSVHKILDFKSPKRSQFERKDLERVYHAFTDLESESLLSQIEADYNSQENSPPKL